MDSPAASTGVAPLAGPGRLPSGGGHGGARKSADERRHEVLAAAVHEFARSGYAGTSTEHIARRAGISQPYLFRLFPNKRALFLAAVALGLERIVDTFDVASRGLSGQEALVAMGFAYGALIADRDLLMLQLHSYAAADDPEVRVCVRDGWSRLVAFVGDRSGADPTALQGFFGAGMLMNVVCALGFDDFGGLSGCSIPST